MPEPADPTLLPHEVTVAGVPVRYGVTGTGDADVVLVHGSAAHHVWWHAVVPFLADTWRVITLDLSGHGDSGHRAEYDGPTWAAEVIAVVRAAGARRPVLAGHSLGGRVALLTAAAYPEEVSALVMFDSGMVVPEALRNRVLAPARPPKVHPTRDAARSAFRLTPPQPDPPAELLAPIADYSVRAVEGGWTWKHGGQRFAHLYDDEVMRRAATLQVPVTYVSGGASTVVDDGRAAQVPALLPGARMVRLPGLHHHLLLEDPRACARIIDEVRPVGE